MNTNSRMHKINELLHRSLANLINVELNDPRLPGVTITGVKVSKDLSIAKVYVSFFNQEKTDENLAMVNGHAKLFRTRLAGKIKLRKMPALRFYYDESLLIGNKMNELFANINTNNDEPND